MQIVFGTFAEIKEQMEDAFTSPQNIAWEVYAKKLDIEAMCIYRTMLANVNHGKYPLEIHMLKNRPAGKHCIYSEIDGEVLDGFGNGIERQRIYICPFDLNCPFPGGRRTDARIYGDLHSCYKKEECQKHKGSIAGPKQESL